MTCKKHTKMHTYTHAYTHTSTNLITYTKNEISNYNFMSIWVFLLPYLTYTHALNFMFTIIILFIK